jgi:hypothetical protein
VAYAVSVCNNKGGLSLKSWYMPNNSLSSAGHIITTITTRDEPRVFSTDANYTLHEREAQGSW